MFLFLKKGKFRAYSWSSTLSLQHVNMIQFSFNFLVKFVSMQLFWFQATALRLCDLTTLSKKRKVMQSIKTTNVKMYV